MRKNIRLSTPAQLQCSHSGVREPGNEARVSNLVGFLDRVGAKLMVLIPKDNQWLICACVLCTTQAHIVCSHSNYTNGYMVCMCSCSALLTHTCAMTMKRLPNIHYVHIMYCHCSSLLLSLLL